MLHAEEEERICHPDSSDTLILSLLRITHRQTTGCEDRTTKFFLSAAINENATEPVMVGAIVDGSTDSGS